MDWTVVKDVLLKRAGSLGYPAIYLLDRSWEGERRWSSLVHDQILPGEAALVSRELDNVQDGARRLLANSVRANDDTMIGRDRRTVIEGQPPKVIGRPTALLKE